MLKVGSLAQPARANARIARHLKRQQMTRTDQSLIQQLGITPYDLRQRQLLFQITERDSTILRKARPHIEPHIERLVATFYEGQLAIPDVAVLIGDAESLNRVARALRRYISEILTGVIDMDYVNSRLRIGLVHKRIGIEPKYYTSAVHALKTILIEGIYKLVPEAADPLAVEVSFKKFIFFDVSLVFDTYIHGLLDEIDSERKKTEQYARDLEEQVRIRTEQLEERSRTDALTGLLNVRHLTEILNRSLRASERRSEPLCFAFLDLDGFKEVNDEYGHKRGDMVLQGVATALLDSVRAEDTCFRYGGDEFCVILPRCSSDEALQIVDQRFRDRLEQVLEDFPGKVGFSVGISEALPGQYPEADDLIRQADRRMYEFKAVAKHCEPGESVQPTEPESKHRNGAALKTSVSEAKSV